MKTPKAWLSVAGLSLLVTGCEFSPQSFLSQKWVQDLWSQAQREGKNAWEILSKQFPNAPEAPPSPSPQPSGSPQAGEFSSTAAQTAKANGELFHEMYQVVFNQEPRDRAQFGNWVDTLNQGASLEGVHNGLIRSEPYRQLEGSSRAASVEALKAFSEELAILELELPSPTEFDEVTASPLPSEPKPAPPVRETLDSPRSSPSPVDPDVFKKQWSQRYAKAFVGNSVYTLKRRIADEALKVVTSKNEFKEKRALWYSKWAVRLCQRNVDFGISLRNKPDEAFHYQWALQNSEDRIKWEVLNRLHRVLNEANQQKQ